ncbi:MAG: hypothetical protein ACM3ML_17375 [Micromonosporaceae bacterium]
MDGDGSGAAMSAPAARRNPDWQDLDPEENERNKRPPYTTKRAG